jgi:crotonobetaine/carnitine-CoA ligase
MEYKGTIRELLEYRARHTPDFIFGVYEDWEISCSTLQARVNGLANGLAGVGVLPGQHVAVMLGNHPDHIFIIFALAELGAVLIPVNVNLRGPSLDFVFQKSAPSTVIVDAEFWDRIGPILANKNVETIIVRNAHTLVGPSGGTEVSDFSGVSGGEVTPPLTTPTLDEIRSISFTSGTTGEPKGVLLTERMLMTFARGAAIASEVRPGDVFLLWEPLYHNSGVQMCILALMEEVKLAMVPKFSASRFWDQIRKHRVTKMHYLGGIIDILLKYPAHPNDKDHNIQLAFGGGCSRSGWRPFENRFGVRIQEVYGLTEASGFSTINQSGKVGSIGRAYPYFEIKIVDDEGKPLGAGQIGEISSARRSQDSSPGVSENPKQRPNVAEGWFTPRSGVSDEEGDSIIKAQETVSVAGKHSAWEVERVLNSHPKLRKAPIGADADVGTRAESLHKMC